MARILLMACGALTARSIVALSVFMAPSFTAPSVLTARRILTKGLHDG